MIKALDDERRLEKVEQFLRLATESGIPITHLAMSFAITHPGITSALIGPRTIPQLDDLLKGLDVALPDDVLDRIDEIVPPGTDIGRLDQTYLPPGRSEPIHVASARPRARRCCLTRYGSPDLGPCVVAGSVSEASRYSGARQTHPHEQQRRR
ncbi:Aldo/keto reductase family protein [Gordonia westfalica]|uniref:Aldo/keto reductase family protein n=1 Tax=Gordonia westfalica TaxID=158898 RepID=A0A1H2GPN2_9ACTN|nr:Aldo/keto reductase family protein [Gordonia westfalica]